MRAKITRTSDWQIDPEYKEFNALEEVLAFAKEVGEELIIKANPFKYKNDEPHDFSIEIYDDYRE